MIFRNSSLSDVSAEERSITAKERLIIREEQAISHASDQMEQWNDY
ncbi:MAG TPA: hypothetical protein VD927_05320 [Chryseosolibacter sp.]|nr:hypothetical protein [Chryseosolibacter sp.]